ncbi:MAG: glycosyltransferase [Deltaproteobacteria bacterium]|nr:glycosyltransferase [Deltaproteobacteria bacterium]
MMREMGEKRIVIFSDSASLIDPECSSAFRELGHEIKIIRLVRNPQNPDIFLSFNLIDRITEIVSFQPDMIFTINGIGLDNDGIIVRICNLLKISLVCWYVDKPFYLDQWTDDIVQPFTFFFLFDASYVEGVKQKGTDLAFPLPLATNPRSFQNVELNQDEISRFSADVVFVGRSEIKKAKSYRQKVEKCLALLGIEQKIDLDKLVDLYLADPTLQPVDIFSTQILHLLCGKKATDPSLIALFDNWMEHEATVKHRKTYIEALEGIDFKVCGEDAWLDIVSKENFIPEVSYFRDLKKIYHTAKININISRPQVKTALNQRLFDAPVSGGFLLTDYRKDLDRYFEVGKEIDCFNSPSELREKIEYYLLRPELRGRMKEAARRRVMEEHTYKNRMQELINIVDRNKKKIDWMKWKKESSRDKQYALVHNFMAAAFGKLGLWDHALAHFQETLAIDENNYDAIHNCANILKNQIKADLNPEPRTPNPEPWDRVLMNIAYFSTKTNTNLVINQVIRLVKEIHDSGINIILYSFEDDGEDYSVVHKFLYDNGISFHSITNQDQALRLREVHDLIKRDNINGSSLFHVGSLNSSLPPMR